MPDISVSHDGYNGMLLEVNCGSDANLAAKVQKAMSITGFFEGTGGLSVNGRSFLKKTVGIKEVAWIPK